MLLPVLGLWTLLRAIWRDGGAPPSSAIGPSSSASRRSKSGTVELAHRALHFDRGLLSRNLGQRVQLHRADRRACAAGLTAPLPAFPTSRSGWRCWCRCTPSSRRCCGAIRTPQDAVLYLVHRAVRLLHVRAAHARALSVSGAGFRDSARARKPEMMGVFAMLTLTCLFNLAYVKHTLGKRDGLSSTRATASRCSTSMLNLAAFALAVRFGLAMLKAGGAGCGKCAGAAGHATSRRRKGVRRRASSSRRPSAAAAAVDSNRHHHIWCWCWPAIATASGISAIRPNRFRRSAFRRPGAPLSARRDLPRSASAAGEAGDRAGHLAVRRSFVELAGRQRDARHDLVGVTYLLGRRMFRIAWRRRWPRLRAARRILPGRFAHRMHRYRVPDLRRDLLSAAVPFHADRRVAGKAQDC